ncbi:MAG TPA: L-seryl-tRNA(Sec) selenium transferase [Stellaceae bacterium]|nr:L-seryl-tRNA(Sec) selenium transferase [Stellaceae bacterium]
MAIIEPMAERNKSVQSGLAALPAVERLLRSADAAPLIAAHGRPAVTDAIRAVLAATRAAMGGVAAAPAEDALMSRIAERLDAQSRPPLRPIFNLTGTVLHTNLGRAVLPREAIDAVAAVMSAPANLEYDLGRGGRGDRDNHLEPLLCRLTGAEAATIVNNNAAAVLLVLNTLALHKEVPTSRGELIEIGGAFRMPDIMARAGCRLREVGTTNRTHLRDYAEAIGPRTGLVMKVHPSNYAIEGFTASVAEAELARLCRERGIVFAVDLGSGALVDLRRFGLPHEPTPQETLQNGADIVTFSGDKLLGGPQAGIIVGRRDLIARIKRNPLKRALRVDKMTIAALAAVLPLYLDPDRLNERLPALRALARPLEAIRAQAERLTAPLADRLGRAATIECVACDSQIGSGALPTQALPSAGLALRPAAEKRGAGAALNRLAAAFRALPIPAIGRIERGALVFDLRCLEDEAAFVAQLARLEAMR